jgi:hypothetical protein
LLRKLAQPPYPEKLLLVYLDFNLRADDSLQAFYELILRQLIQIFQTQQLPFEKLESLYQPLTEANPTSFTLARNFLAAFDQVFVILNQSQPPRRLILLFDEFDQPLQFLPDLAFLHLRALKDRYPDQLSYVVATALPLLAYEQDDQPDALAEFYELFEATDLLRLSGLSPAETADLAGCYNPALKPAQLEQLYRLSGGHPALTRLLTQKLSRLLASSSASDSAQQTEVEAEIEEILKLDSEIRLECRRLWRSLHPTERQRLFQYLEGIQTISLDSPLGTLTERGLLTHHPDGSSKIFALAFEWFIREELRNLNQENNSGARTAATNESPNSNSNFTSSNATPPYLGYDPHREIVYFLGSNQEHLPPLPLTGNAARLFQYLYLRQGETCSKEQLISAIWGNGGYSTENLDRLVSDLRQEIGDQHKEIIKTIPRRGLLMQGVREYRGS